MNSAWFLLVLVLPSRPHAKGILLFQNTQSDQEYPLSMTGAIDRAPVVRRHTVSFQHAGPIDGRSTRHNTLTVGNGEMGFGADLTGLQSLNNSYHTPDYPLYTLSNWGWHAPDPALVGAKVPMFRPDGTLNYVYENVTINSSDTRPGKGNRTVPYQFNCADYNDPALCSYQHQWPARVNLGQLSFVLPGRQLPPTPGVDSLSSTAPKPGCQAVGTWCNSAQVTKDHATGSYSCSQKLDVVANVSAGDGCNASASCSKGGWQGLPFCQMPGGQIEMYNLHPAVHNGYFADSCDLIKWNNSFDHSTWCRSGTPACVPHSSPPAPPGDNQPTGDFRFLKLSEISTASQSLDLYTGLLESNWTHTDPKSHLSSRVVVTTAVDSETDTVSTSFTAPALLGLAVQLAFCTVSRSGGACEWKPYGSPGGPLEDHRTTVLGNSSAGDGSGRLDLFRENGADTYSVSCEWSGSAQLKLTRTAEHAFALHRPHNVGARAGAADEVVTAAVSCRFQLNCCVGPQGPVAASSLSTKNVPSFVETTTNSVSAWREFWERGAFVDIAGQTSNPQAFELERRTIQSAYLLRSQESGSIMPQESGLLYNSWTGKHHSEMRYWHQTWLPLWGHPELLAKSDQWFVDRLENATSNTAMQGYQGTRWGKMLGEANMWGLGKGDGTKRIQYWESPNNCNPGLVWHQPHVIYMSELEYRAAKDAGAKAEVLHRLKDVVLSTAAFLADFPERRIGTGTNGAYLDLGPPLVSAAEGEGPYDVWNPSYELTQFNFSLDLAQQWRERLGMSRDEAWEEVRMSLAPLPITTGNAGGLPTYNRHQNCLPSVFAPNTQHCRGGQSHPALNGAMGCLPGDRYGVDRTIMNNTLHETLKVWKWGQSWGWDQPMVAMTATRLEQPQLAVDTLLMNTSTNVYLPTGYNHPSGEGETSAYLPGNGGILIAVGLMAGGWENGPKTEAPGFPPEWKVRAEGFTPYF